jgi:hypothetical protein
MEAQTPAMSEIVILQEYVQNQESRGGTLNAITIMREVWPGKSRSKQRSSISVRSNKHVRNNINGSTNTGDVKNCNIAGATGMQ